MTYFDAVTLRAVVEELSSAVLGGRIQEVIQVDELTLGFEVYRPPRRHYLVLSAHPQLARAHLSGEKTRRGVETASPLLLLLRKHVRDARLVGVRQVPDERILWLEADHHEQGPAAIVVEIMGRHSNIMLVDPGGIILESVKRVGPDVNRYRVVLPRQPYVPPPPQDKLAPDDLTELRLRDIVAAAAPRDPLWRALVAGVRGVSPLLAREWCQRAYRDSELAAGEATRVGPLLEQWARLCGPEARWEPCVARREGSIAAFAPYLLTHLGEPEAVASISEAVALYVRAETTRDPYGAAKNRVKALIEAAGRQLERKRQSLERALAPEGDIETLRRSGELLLAYGQRLQPGQASLRVSWEDAGEVAEGPPLEIAVDPDLAVAENARKYFDRYARARRAAQEVPSLVGEVSLGEQYLRQLLTDLELASSQPEIEEVRLALDEAGYLKPSAPGSARRTENRPHPAPVAPLGGRPDDLGGQEQPAKRGSHLRARHRSRPVVSCPGRARRARRRSQRGAARPRVYPAAGRATGGLLLRGAGRRARCRGLHRAAPRPPHQGRGSRPGHVQPRNDGAREPQGSVTRRRGRKSAQSVRRGAPALCGMWRAGSDLTRL